MENEAIQQILLFATIIAPFVTGGVQAIKKAFPIKKNYLPAISVIVGLGIGAAAAPLTDLDLTMRLWAGGVAGLSGTGLFELIKPRTGITKGDK